MTLSSTRTFARHYVEMIVAMFAGMLVLGAPVALLLDVDAAEFDLIGMAGTMTVPMVAWMRYRGHAWMPCLEMAAAMIVPTFAALGLMWSGALDFHGAMMIEHIAMLPLMLAAMLLRRDEYTSHVHHAAVAA